MKEKKCTGCREVKPMGEFHKRTQSPNGRAARCKHCARDRMNRRRDQSTAPRAAAGSGQGGRRAGKPDDHFGDSAKWLAVALLAL